MNLMSLIYLFVIALIISAIFSYGFRTRGPWGSFWIFFIILFLGIWAADIWFPEVGPYWGEVYWFPPLAIGILIALILAAATPPAERPPREAARKEESTLPEGPGFVALGIFFWALLIILIAVVLIGLFANF